ncbi:MAG TPA: hypothetical protein VLZ75_02570 [Chitinophagales bacterium]|jgi:hypothetical protein|nr:hypothetical protein [Chitinophagales bacterium]
MTQIVFNSQNETDILGFKVSRCNEEDVNEQQLLNEIIEGRYDICRLKLPAEDEMISMKLESLGIPFFFSGSIRRYRTKIIEKPSGDFFHPQMTYEMYDGSQEELLMEMLKGTWGDYPLGYYRAPYLCELVNKEVEIESVFNFYKKNNLNSLHPKNSIMFMNDQGNYVGFFALNHVSGELESHIGGILEPYRKGGYFLDMLRYIKNYCVDQKLSHFVFGARNENAIVQKIFQDVGFRPIGSENVFHILSFMSLSQVDKVVLNSHEDDFGTLLRIVNEYATQYFSDFYISKIQSSEINRKQEKNDLYQLIVSMPIKTEQFFLVLIQKVLESGEVLKCYYFTGKV